MTRSRPLAALAGIGFAVLAILGALVYPSDPGFAAEPKAIAGFYDANVDALLAANSIYLVSTALLLVFAGCLWSASKRAEGGDGRVALTAFGAAVAGAALMLGGTALDMMGALRVDELGAIDPQTATVLWDGSNVLFGLAAPIAMAVLVLATAYLSLRRELLPKWHGAIGVVLGVALLLPPVNYVAIIAFIFWVLLTSVTLYIGHATESSAGRVATAAA